MEFIDLIPLGSENAISRAKLVEYACVVGLVPEHTKDKDRYVRGLIEKARRDFVILNNQNGGGYYRCSSEDLMELKRYIKQEESRAKTVFVNLKKARALYEDYANGRIEEG